MTGRLVILTLTRIEAAHLRALVQQFSSLVEATQSEPDPALDRLAPDAYPDDADAAREFRDLTRGDLLGRRWHDAATVLRDLDTVEEARLEEALSPVDVPIEGDALDAWLRTLAAVRLVLASRLGIETAEDHDEEDPRFALYDWLGYRLDGLVQAADEG
ncbi:DUF2017 family protein [Microbacterium betulae]|uniref:DUF2017 family protein n=1 Tax=Microbacterium betulae TaxID=2981139 RepID=A0AA97FNC6_9MICO|nr:DUF2017 family protein [Microbacterium sp. AB]WOF24547.1 DUF2017 family protein [Microbacterium sp. AB]